MGVVTGGAVFIYTSYALAGIVLAGIAIYTMARLMAAKRKLKMLAEAKNAET